MSTLDLMLARHGIVRVWTRDDDPSITPAEPAEPVSAVPSVGPNAHRPEHGGVGDRAYLQRLAARGERDES
jgi:hypothetical protein